ncbi:MAG: bifunctional 3,4-dihydroxy-2-butanone-4-phosphate synthase/GTP cyclohydrolase II [Ignavibacteria bacterium]|nr:bifunctional 3,4-dihydroxy-2-butanone-4-phosphate synthase/GTP cyclohydrolase II [Ignavibacteria bacterium]
MKPRKTENKFNSIESAIADFKKGKCVIVVDDEDRENEGDLIYSAEKSTPELVNMLIKYTSGVICVPMEDERLKELKLNMMTQVNTALHQTAFTISVDYKHGTSTGISASDRNKTILSLVNKKTKPDDLGRPGHVFPLRAFPGGVLRRAGHTEAAVDLARLAGHYPAGVLCEIIKEDGNMARVPKLMEIAKKLKLKIITIKDLINYRLEREVLIEKVVDVNLPTRNGTFRLHMFRNILDGKEHLALIKGDISPDKPIIVRVHSECLTGDILGSLKCDCRDQLVRSLKIIEHEKNGIVLYMRQEGRGIGLANKLKAYKLQEEGKDTVEANEALGFKADLRDYGIGAQILRSLGVKKIILLTNNPKKVVGLKGYGLEIVKRMPIEIPSNVNNERYLKTKRDKLGHLLLINKNQEN